MGDFKKLHVWQEAKELAVKIYKLTSKGSLAFDFGLRDQMRRSAISVASNIAEGDESGTNKQGIRFFYHARASAAELHTQVIIASEVGYFYDDKMNEICQRCAKIGAMLNKLISARS